MFSTGHVALNYHLNKYRPDRIILSERLRSGTRFLHFCYHEVHQCDRASEHHHRMARLSPGFTASTLPKSHYISLRGRQRAYLPYPTCPLRTLPYTKKKYKVKTYGHTVVQGTNIQTHSSTRYKHTDKVDSSTRFKHTDTQ